MKNASRKKEKRVRVSEPKTNYKRHQSEVRTLFVIYPQIIMLSIYIMPPKRAYKKSSRRPYKKAYKKRSGVSSKVKKYVKKAIHSLAENKIVSINQALRFGSVTNSPLLNMYPVLPYTGYTTIPAGVTQGTRIGNRCKVMKVILKYVLYATAYDAGFNPNPQPCEVQLFLLNLKQATGVMPTATQLAGLVQVGSTSTALAGNLSDIALNSWNKDVFNVKSWTHKVGYSAYTGTGGLAGQQYFQSNDFKFNVIRRMDITKMVASTLRFDDGGSTHLGKNMFFGFQCVPAGGGVLNASATPCSIQYWIDILYEDM